MIVIFVGSVPVSPNALFVAGDLKSQIVSICLVNFFDLLFFMAFSFLLKTILPCKVTEVCYAERHLLYVEKL